MSQSHGNRSHQAHFYPRTFCGAVFAPDRLDGTWTPWPFVPQNTFFF